MNDKIIKVIQEVHEQWKGGSGSGNFGHTGRPGKRGGSGGGKGGGGGGSSSVGDVGSVQQLFAGKLTSKNVDPNLGVQLSNKGRNPIRDHIKTLEDAGFQEDWNNTHDASANTRIFQFVKGNTGVTLRQNKRGIFMFEADTNSQDWQDEVRFRV